MVSSYCHQLNVCPSDFKWFQVLSAIRCKLFQVVSSFDLCDCLEISYVFNILVFSSLVIFHGLKLLYEIAYCNFQNAFAFNRAFFIKIYCKSIFCTRNFNAK